MYFVNHSLSHPLSNYRYMSLRPQFIVHETCLCAWDLALINFIVPNWRAAYIRMALVSLCALKVFSVLLLSHSLSTLAALKHIIKVQFTNWFLIEALFSNLNKDSWKPRTISSLIWSRMQHTPKSPMCETIIFILLIVCSFMCILRGKLFFEYFAIISQLVFHTIRYNAFFVPFIEGV